MVIFESEKVNKIISEAYTQGVKLSDIANQLAGEGLTTKYGKGWTGASVSSYAHKKLGLSNREVHIKNKMNQVLDNFPEHKEPLEKMEPLEKKQTKNLDNLVIIENNRVITTSLNIAEIFEKEHYNVLESIKSLECSDKFRALNFQASTYLSSQNKELPMFLITRDGFSLLAFSFTGKKAMEFKELYIEEFNKMEEYLKQPVKMLTIPEQIQAQANLLVEHDKKIVSIEKELGNLKSQVSEFKQVKSIDSNFFLEPELSSNISTFNFYKDDRKKLNQLVNHVARFFSCPHEQVWTLLYNEFNTQKGINLQLQTKNRNKLKPQNEQILIIDLADEKGYIPELYALLSYIYQDKKNQIKQA